MAMDGSFTSAAAMRRFLARSPPLQFKPSLLALCRKGDDLAAEDVVNSLAELVLHPSYTISLLGCFRVVGERLVAKSVELLRVVVGMNAISVDEDGGSDEVGEDEICVIQFYAGKGRLLRLHELACLALCRALDLAPFLSRTILNYFSFAPPPFQRILKMSLPVPSSYRNADSLLGVVRVSLRLLQLDSGSFVEMWDWSCFIDVVQIKMEGGWNTDSLCDDIRWCGAHILLIVLKLGEQLIEYFDLNQEIAFRCYKRWEEFCEDVAVEKAGFYMDPFVNKANMIPGIITGDTLELTSRLSENMSLSNLSLHRDEAQSMRRACKRVACDTRLKKVPFVLTSTIKRSFEMARLAVSQKWPILLHGPSGAGKSALILQLAEASSKQVLFLHMDEQMDVKALIGSYVCAEQPGEFRWQSGSLTQALQKGLWTVFEDIDKAPSEVHSVIGPLFESLGSYMTGHGEGIKISEDFRLFATVSHRERDWCSHIGGSAALDSNWRKLMVGAPTDNDILDIIKTRYPILEPLAEKIMDTFKKVNYLVPCQLGYHVNGADSVDVFPRFTLRDLLKWCSRIASVGLSMMGTCLSTTDRKKIYIEAVDIFAASSASCNIRLILMKEMASLWCIPVLDAESLYHSNKPTVQSFPFVLQVGRVMLEYNQGDHTCPKKKFFAEIGTSMRNLEKIACSVKCNEPVLLVGETGTGKTTLVQNLAARLGHPLTVLNLSQQSDVSDLLGGFKPTDVRFVCIPLYGEFKTLFTKTYSKKENKVILQKIAKYVNGGKWKELLIQFQRVVSQHKRKLQQLGESGCGEKRKKPMGEDVLQHWESFSMRVDSALKQMQASVMPFSFVEGAFVTALKDGHWILLDEINLAPPDTLQRILGVLEGEIGSLCLAERGDVDYIVRHPNFRIFACMNPATDAGKKDLPYSVRSRFTEYFVDDLLSDEDLNLFVGKYLDDLQKSREIVNKIVKFYREVTMKTQETLQDGANQKPQFSLRSLARALDFTKKARNAFGFNRALYDGFCMFFLNLLDGPSYRLMNNMILSYLLGGNAPLEVEFERFVQVNRHHEHLSFVQNYELTKSITLHLTNLARAAFIKSPVLLQGPTSSGKTSLIRYLAAVTGHEFVRINNHEHTDLQEYFGTYIPDFRGELKFHEGPLVKAVRFGHWIVLDELNLAPTDVLEALNRLLDDNRELFIPDLLETVPAHPDFMLFATQNPPTLYGGRKILSRAFRNRFVEIFVDEIPEDELQKILKRRCKVPESYAVKMVEVMKELQLHRQSSRAFVGKHGFMTPRDLFRWAERFHSFGCSYEDLAKEGYFLLAERLREQAEKDFVIEVLEKHLRVKIDTSGLYRQKADVSEDICNHQEIKQILGKIYWTTSMERLYFLVERCYRLREPVLLVGETGGGKTSVCQLISMVFGSKLHILNCHQYTETTDFIGGFHPVRERSQLAAEYKYSIEQLKISKVFEHFFANNILPNLSSDIEQALSTLSSLQDAMSTVSSNIELHQDSFKQILQNLHQLYQKWQAIFEWQDGPLVEAMKCGDFFLMDEISLADDSVLERLNSILEPERVLTLAEKGGSNLEQITAHQDFFLLATMNPGGDYGKKELSPALRNRFTEIWVPPISDLKELRSIALRKLDKLDLSWIIDSILKFWEWFHSKTGRVLTVRDLMAWVTFINATESSLGPVNSFLHGAFLVLLDGLSLGSGISSNDAMKLREDSLQFLLDQVESSSFENSDIQKLGSYGWGSMNTSIDHVRSEHQFGISPFYIPIGNMPCKKAGFEFLAPTTSRNVFRVLRALQLHKPVLLEGSPGVGKTSLVVALAEFSGHSVVRINLSEQTDIMDLLGSDLPVESEEGIKFAWSDGILLQALKDGKWVLLDELNLAPQSVLEGLNAILDHRAEVYIPELGASFKCPPTFRVFACQNPTLQGGGRKGLPKSFLNRFTKVYADELVDEDYLFICSSLFPSISKVFLSKLIRFNNRIYKDTMVLQKYGEDGSPWEFNLRDVIRSCQLIGSPSSSKEDCFLSIVYIQRMRTMSDRKRVLSVYEEVFGAKPHINMYPRVQISPKRLIVGTASFKRNDYQQTKHVSNFLRILPSIGQSLEAVLHCVQHQWLCILVGKSSSGKTSLVRLLAQLTGNALHELNLSPGTDISELIGCFEQYSAFRHIRQVICQVEGYVKEYSSLVFKSFEALSEQQRSFMSKWFTFLTKLKSISVTAVTCREEILSHGLLELLVDVIEYLMQDKEIHRVPVSWSYDDLKSLLELIMKLRHEEYLQRQSTKFEWVKGQLVNAIESGEWILLENANLCSPTVLDRINSLVEPSGLITVNECGLVNGKPLVLKAHPNFRLFFTVNPVYGEVSRAMRNRGVEVFVMPPYWVQSDCKEAEMRDLRRFLITSGIPSTRLVDAMAHAHLYARDRGRELGIHITLLELTQWTQLFYQLIVAGNRPLWALNLSWEHIYLSSLGEFFGNDIVNHGKISFLSDSEFSEFSCLLEHSFCLPGGWPSPLKLRDFIFYSREASVKQNCQYLEFLGAQNASYYARASFHEPSLSHDTLKLLPAVMPAHVLHQFLYPMMNHQEVKHTSFDFEHTVKMLWFAANWAIEQASEDDLDMYISYFEWYSCKLEPFCSFFKSYLSIFKQGIWKNLVNHWRKFSSNLHYNNNQQVPLLSLELIEMDIKDVHLEAAKSNLYSAINSVNCLQLSCMQWYAEDTYPFKDRQELSSFYPLLRSLRQLEMEALNITVCDISIDFPVKLYDELIEKHVLFWNIIKSSRIDLLAVCWHSLKKEAKKLQDICPSSVFPLIDVMDEVKHLKKITTWDFETPKSLLWAYGWHPLVPSSQETYVKMEQLLHLCSSVWQPGLNFSKQMYSAFADTKFLHVVVLSAVSDIRHLAVQGVSMASCICDDHSHDATAFGQGIEEIHKMLEQRIATEKCRLEMAPEVAQKSKPENLSSICCTFCMEVMPTPWIESWIATLPLLDHRSIVHELNLLLDLSRSILLPSDEEVRLALSAITMQLKSALEFSLKSLSRPPTDFVPHQKLLWILDSWESVNSAIVKLRNSLCEMWYKWHSSLWVFGQKEQMNHVDVGCHQYGMPIALFCPIITATMNQILQFPLNIKDIQVYGMKIRAASSYIWEDSQLEKKLADKLLSAARYLFGQVLFAYKKSFVAEKFQKIESILWHAHDDCISKDSFEMLKLLVKSSNDSQLKSLMELYIIPLLGRLYLPCSGHDLLRTAGLAWLYLGGLHFHLLQSPCDPTLKYTMKYAQLMGKISRLETELMVRQESCYLAGGNSVKGKYEKRLHLKESLDLYKKSLQKKLVFRPDPGKYAKFKHLYDDFKKMVETSLAFSDFPEERVILDQISIDKACNWQETSNRFIHQLSEEYMSYNDVIQPIQVSIYEMKIGLSIVVSSALLETFLNRIQEDNVERIHVALCSFIQFPRCFALGVDSVGADSVKSDRSLYCSEHILTFDIHVLYKLVSLSQSPCPEKVEAIIRQILLNIVRDHVYSTSLMDKASFQFIEKIFEEFSSLWTSIKSEAKAKEKEGIQPYKFRPRAIILEDITEVSVLELKNLAAEDSLTSEWEEVLYTSNANSGNPSAIEHDNLIKEWNSVEEILSKGVVHVHSQLFGSFEVLGMSRRLHSTEKDKLETFMQAYKVYKDLIKVLPPLLSSSIDASLLPEHLLHLSLEYNNRFHELNDSDHNYHFYKDSNTPALAKMIEPLAAFQQQMVRLLEEYPEHSEIQKVFQMTELLMTLSPDTPIAKALLILQFLVSRMESLQESGLKSSFSVQLKPILELITSWKKLEIDNWFQLLDSIVKMYEINAGKLWFPLYSVLHRGVTYDDEGNNLATIQSLEEFIQTSNIGEFKKRLELLLSFHGQFNAKAEFNINSSKHFGDNVTILYNVFGYYMQFLPQISQHIEHSKSMIRNDLKDLVKLSRWEDPHSFSKRSRQKLWKLMQKFNDVMQQPAMLFLYQEELRKSVIDVPRLVDLNSMVDDLVKKPMVELTIDEVDLQFGHVERTRSLWLDNLKKLFDSTIGGEAFAYILTQDQESLLQQCLSNHSACTFFMEGWKSLKDLFHTVLSSAHIWKHGTKTLEKRRAFSNLLAVLEGCGLSRHISRKSEVDMGSNQLIGFFMKPAYDLHHLLPGVSSSMERVFKLDCVSHHFASMFDRDLRSANEYYFKSIFMLQRAKQICSEKFHKDITLEQVYKSNSFLEHLVLIQQGQRSLVYGILDKLLKNRELIFPLKSISFTDDKCSVISNQHAASVCMWQQKELFDGLHALSKDMSMLLGMAKRSHIDTCGGVRAQLSDALSLVEKFIPEIGKSKEMLDCHLLDRCRLISTPKGCRSVIVTRPMEQVLVDNFQLVNNISEDFERLGVQIVPRNSMVEQIISRFTYYLEKAKLVKKMFLSVDDHVAESVDATSAFTESCEETTKHILVAFVKISEMSDYYFNSEQKLTEILLENFAYFTGCLHLDLVYDSLQKTVKSAMEYANDGSKELESCRHVEMYLKCLYKLVNILLCFAEGIFLELLAMHRAVAEMTHMLANVLALLFTNGFGSVESGEEESREAGRTQEASGTGMGEGEGVNDVSNQLEDEEQLLGTSEKLAGESSDTSKNLPNKEDKGIEMEEEFAADTYSLSEGSGDEGEDDKEEVDLDSAMGEASNDKNIVDEKRWDREADESPDKPENYDSGKSVKETDSTAREMRAKDEKADEARGPNADEQCQHGEDANDTNDEHLHDEDTEEMKLEKTGAHENHTDVSEQHQDFEDKMSMNEPEQDGMTEHELDCSEMEKEKVDDNNEDHLNENTSDAGDAEGNEMADLDPSQVNESMNLDDPFNMTSEINGNENFEVGNMEMVDGERPKTYSMMTMDHRRPSQSTKTQERSVSDMIDVQNGAASLESLHTQNIMEMEMALPTFSKDGNVSTIQQDTHLPSADERASERNRANPYRCLGDALEEWKERVHVTSDPDPTDKRTAENNEKLQDVDTDEYKYVTELEYATSQALGSAMPEQANTDIDGKKNIEDEDRDLRENVDEMIIEEENLPEICSSKGNAASVKHKSDRNVPDLAGPVNDLPVEEEDERKNDLLGDPSLDVVSVGKYDLASAERLHKLVLEDQELGTARKLLVVADNSTVTKWRRYELDTSKLSQELSEKLRLIMEPTQASKLQGDYRSGKRINLKKVIAYIASYFRKDKIWLRRTRPHKRDYQVVVVIDDSRSMTEGGCGEVATKALITVCRAMSQLEVGQLAVVSFGESGNIRLLHDFHEPFTSEAGVKMLSGLDFKQDNKIGDDPVVDLLKYLNEKLERAVTTARLPSGQNPLEQLILIIGDGRFNEQPELLKPFVRDMVSRKRMVAYIILDSQEESILDYGKVSLVKGKTIFTKYLDSFPFPYYIVLKKIDTLPGTLADLLRQWFELMQRTTD